MNFQLFPFPVLESERLILRRVTTNDINEIIQLRSNPETMKYIPRPLIKTTEDAIHHIAQMDEKLTFNEGINWGISLQEDPKLIGMIGFHRMQPDNYRAEIGYMLMPEFHRTGIITEAVNIVIRFGFNELKLHSIEAIINPENTASEKVLQKCNFVKEAHLRESLFYNGKFLDKVIYSLLDNK